MRNTAYFEIFSDVYSYMKSCYPASAAPEAWAEMLQGAAQLYKKYIGTEWAPFVRSLTLAILHELERTVSHEEGNN